MSIEQIKSLEKFIDRGEKQFDALAEMKTEIEQISEELAVSIERARIELGVLRSKRHLPEKKNVCFVSIE